MIPLLSCAGLAKFPTDKLYEFDPKVPVCAEYKVIDFENLKYQWVRDIPFKECPAIFGFTAAKIPKVLNWGRDAIKYSKEHCH